MGIYTYRGRRPRVSYSKISRDILRDSKPLTTIETFKTTKNSSSFTMSTMRSISNIDRERPLPTLTRVVLNNGSQNFQLYGIDNHDICKIEYRHPATVEGMASEIASYYRLTYEEDMKRQFCPNFDNPELTVIWNCQNQKYGNANQTGSRTKLHNRNFRQLMEMVRVRNGQDVLEAKFWQQL